MNFVSFWLALYSIIRNVLRFIGAIFGFIAWLTDGILRFLLVVGVLAVLAWYALFDMMQCVSAANPKFAAAGTMFIASLGLTPDEAISIAASIMAQVMIRFSFSVLVAMFVGFISTFVSMWIYDRTFVPKIDPMPSLDPSRRIVDPLPAVELPDIDSLRGLK